MAKPPDESKKPKKAKDPARPTRAKAARPALPPIAPALADLLNPAINRGEAGVGSQTGLQPPPDNSRDRRADFAAAHRARKSTPSGFGEVPQSPYRDNAELREASPELARILGIEGDEGDEGTAPASPPSPAGGGSAAEGGRGGVAESRAGELTPTRRAARADPPPSRGRWAPSPGRANTPFEGDRDTTVRRPRPAPVALGEMGVAATAQSLDKLLREGRAEFLDDAGAPRVWTPHRPPRPEKSEGGISFVVKSEYEPKGDQPTAIAELVEGVQPPRPHPGAARRHRLGQDLHDGQGDRGDAAARHHPGAEQDAGGAALRRVQELLSRQRGRVLRLLLRLLPARSLRAAHRHLHREGILDQRPDRPHAPLGDARAARARRRDHRRVGVVHLRHRLGRDLYGDDLHAQARRAHRPAPADRRPRRRCSTSARTPISPAAPSGCAAT